MIKNILSGIIIGAVNIIPGLSGGIIIVILGLFDKLMNAISDIFKRKATNRKENILFLLQIIIGLVIGLISFANIIDILFNNWYTQTIYCFIGFILFSIPFIKEREMPKMKISIPFFILGLMIIVALIALKGNDNGEIINTFPTITLSLLLKMFILGIITAIATIMPGISGAMILLILGYYHLFKFYIANILTFNSIIIIPLIFIGLGIIIGVVVSAKMTTWLLKNYRHETISAILGLIVMSALVLIPLDVTYGSILVISSIITFLFGGMIVIIIEKLKNQKTFKV